jgi:long-chain acyl-CoA synthetase
MKRMLLNNVRKWRGWSQMQSIRTPTLVITGERDRYFARRYYRDVGDSIPGAQVIDVGASKHKVQLERHRAVNRAIERFVGVGADGRQISWREQTRQRQHLTNRPWLKSYGEHVPHTVPVPRQPLYKFLEAAAEWLPKRTATIYAGSRLNYQQLDRRVNQFAHALLGLGVRPGDRVMVVLPNVPQLIVAYYATLKIGGAVVFPSSDANRSQIEDQLRSTGARVLVTLDQYGALADAIQAHVPLGIVLAETRMASSKRGRKQVLARREAAGLVQQGKPEASGPGVAMHQLMMDAARHPPEIDVSSQDLAAILYTSGTSEAPKGVRLTHANLVANTLQTRHCIPDLHYGQEIFLSVIPLTHSYGMTTAMNIPIALGATIVLLPAFDVDQVLDHIKRHKPTLFPGVPTMYMAINQAPGVRSYGLSSIKICVSGAASLPIEVQETFEKLTRGRLVEGYGLTEASPVTHLNPIDGASKVGSIGVPVPNTDAKIVDLVTGEDLPEGQIGELVVKGPQVMRGYWGQDDESLQDTGWLHTGDVATMDVDGFFQIIDRTQDVITVDGCSVYPRDVEEVLYENNSVLEVAVVGLPSGSNEQKVKAFVVPRPGANPTKEELLALCYQRLEACAVPSDIEFRMELPKSSVGKVLRRYLVEGQR